MDELDRRVAMVKRLVCAGVRRCEAAADADRLERELSRIGRRALAVCLGTAASSGAAGRPGHRRS